MIVEYVLPKEPKKRIMPGSYEEGTFFVTDKELIVLKVSQNQYARLGTIDEHFYKDYGHNADWIEEIWGKPKLVLPKGSTITITL